jgi:hypothetical protein
VIVPEHSDSMSVGWGWPSDSKLLEKTEFFTVTAWMPVLARPPPPAYAFEWLPATVAL